MTELKSSTPKEMAAGAAPVKARPERTSAQGSAQTPIQFILRSGVQIFTVDYADIATMVAVGTSEENAQWVAWTLGGLHKVPCKLGEGIFSTQAAPIDE